MLTRIEESTKGAFLPSAGFSIEELDQFRREGYLVVRGLVPEESRGAMLEATRVGLEAAIPPVEYEAELHYPGAPESINAEGGHTIRRLKQAHARHPAFSEWIADPDVVGRLQQLLGGRVVMPLAHHNCIMTKQPRYSSDTLWHQDIRYWSYTRPELISVWLALGKEEHRNGCLYVIPGTHTTPIARERLDDELFLRPELPENATLIARKLPVELAAGDVLFFHCRTFHAAGKNTTQDPKFSVVFTFRQQDNPPIPGSRSAGFPELLLPEVG